MTPLPRAVMRSSILAGQDTGRWVPHPVNVGVMDNTVTMLWTCPGATSNAVCSTGHWRPLTEIFTLRSHCTPAGQGKAQRGQKGCQRSDGQCSSATLPHQSRHLTSAGSRLTTFMGRAPEVRKPSSRSGKNSGSSKVHDLPAQDEKTCKSSVNAGCPKPCLGRGCVIGLCQSVPSSWDGDSALLKLVVPITSVAVCGNSAVEGLLGSGSHKRTQRVDPSRQLDWPPVFLPTVSVASSARRTRRGMGVWGAKVARVSKPRCQRVATHCA